MTGPGRRSSPYERLGGEGLEHPVDRLVSRRCRNHGRTRRILAGHRALVRALGDQRHRWLRLEEMLNERQTELEAAYFDVGYEQGRAAGREEALGALRGGSTVALLERIKVVTMDSPVAPSGKLGALLAAAFALALDL